MDMSVKKHRTNLVVSEDEKSGPHDEDVSVNERVTHRGPQVPAERRQHCEQLRLTETVPGHKQQLQRLKTQGKTIKTRLFDAGRHYDFVAEILRQLPFVFRGNANTPPDMIHLRRDD